MNGKGARLQIRIGTAGCPNDTFCLRVQQMIRAYGFKMIGGTLSLACSVFWYRCRLEIKQLVN